ncbi:MAG: hypothetical protein ACK4ND_16705 [Cytophagaceae bacterium]
MTFLSKILLIALFLHQFSFSFSQNEANSSDSKKLYEKKTYERGNVLTLHPLAFTETTFLIGWEHNIKRAKNFSIKIGAGFTLSDYPDSRFFPSYAYDLNFVYGYQFELQPRFYMGEHDFALKGFYFAPYAHYRFISVDYNKIAYDPEFMFSQRGEAVTVSSNAFSGGVLFGYQLMSTKRLVMDLAVGGGITFSDGDFISDYPNFVNLFSTGVKPRILVAVGYLF